MKALRQLDLASKDGLEGCVWVCVLGKGSGVWGVGWGGGGPICSIEGKKEEKKQIKQPVSWDCG